jgi:hypothetical protein
MYFQWGWWAGVCYSQLLQPLSVAWCSHVDPTRGLHQETNLAWLLKRGLPNPACCLTVERPVRAPASASLDNTIHPGGTTYQPEAARCDGGRHHNASAACGYPGLQSCGKDDVFSTILLCSCKCMDGVPLKLLQRRHRRIPVCMYTTLCGAGGGTGPSAGYHLFTSFVPAGHHLALSSS